MTREGNGYRLSFRFDEIREEDSFPKEKGFAYLFALICQPGKAIPVEEMDVAAGLPAAIDTSPIESVGEEAIRAVEAELRRLKEIMDEPTNQEEFVDAEDKYVRLEKFHAKTVRYPKHSVPEMRNRPRSVDDAFKKITDRVRIAIDRARDKILKVMPNCGDYLFRTVAPKNQTWIYDPKWVIMTPKS